jgi:hypothetical protein
MMGLGFDTLTRFAVLTPIATALGGPDIALIAFRPYFSYQLNTIVNLLP